MRHTVCMVETAAILDMLCCYTFHAVTGVLAGLVGSATAHPGSAGAAAQLVSAAAMHLARKQAAPLPLLRDCQPMVSLLRHMQVGSLCAGRHARLMLIVHSQDCCAC